MSQFLPIPIGAAVGLSALQVAQAAGASDVVAGGVAFVVALAVTFVLADWDRFPNSNYGM